MAQERHFPQAGMKASTTWSPGSMPVDAGADLFHDAGAFVAADHRERDGDVAGDQVGVGMAQPGGGELDEDLLLLRRVEVDLLDAPLLPEAPQDGGLDLHTSVLSAIIFS